MSHELTINDCELLVHLGWTEEERQNKQRVTFSLNVFFHDTLQAASTDQLHDTVCYRTLIQHLRSHVAHSSFALLEYLGEQLLLASNAFLKTCTVPAYELSLTVTKWPCISGLPNGVSFTCATSSDA